jgi:hypothetical protein
MPLDYVFLFCIFLALCPLCVFYSVCDVDVQLSRQCFGDDRRVFVFFLRFLQADYPVYTISSCSFLDSDPSCDILNLAGVENVLEYKSVAPQISRLSLVVVGRRLAMLVSDFCFQCSMFQGHHSSVYLTQVLCILSVFLKLRGAITRLVIAAKVSAIYRKDALKFFGERENFKAKDRLCRQRDGSSSLRSCEGLLVVIRRRNACTYTYTGFSDENPPPYRYYRDTLYIAPRLFDPTASRFANCPPRLGRPAWTLKRHHRILSRDCPAQPYNL